MILLQSFLSTQKQRIVQCNYSLLVRLCFLAMACRCTRVCFKAHMLLFSAVAFLHTVNLSTHLLDAHTFPSCIIFKIHSLCAIMCTHDTSIVIAFVIAWHFKAQSQ